MEYLQAYKFELPPTGAQAQQMRRFAGACRFVLTTLSTGDNLAPLNALAHARAE
jgi:hypothetical protein